MMVNYLELKKNTDLIMDSVEKGEKVCVMRDGQEIAEIIPINHFSGQSLSWKQKRKKIKLGGELISTTITQERNFS